MSQIQTAILAIVPGRHRLGVAVFRSGYLCYYRGKSLRQFRTEESLREAVRKFLAELVTRYGVNHLAIQTLIAQQKTSPLLVTVAEEVRIFSETEESVNLHEYSPFFVRQAFCHSATEEEPAIQKNAARQLAGRYPELERYLCRTKDWEKRYYRYIFSAIALGAVCSEELKNRKNV
jgi:Holliday junction resolvasome RuvABC endonuclease subunit